MQFAVREYILSLTASLLLIVGPSSADLLVDDFDFPGLADSNGPSDIDQQDAGALPGNRILIAKAVGGAIGHWRTDASITTPSVLHMLAEDLVIGDGHGWLGTAYTFGIDPDDGGFLPYDLTQNGANTAMRLDFAYSLGPTPVRNIRVLAGALPSGLLHSVLDSLPYSEEPFSVVVPFDFFVDRFGLPPGNRFTSVLFLELQFQSAGNSFWPIHDDQGWQVGLERVSMVAIDTCDFSLDGECHVDDLNSLLAEGPVSVGVPTSQGVNDHFDLTGDGVIDESDLDAWLADAAQVNGLASPYKRGDANLDGAVDVLDFNRWNAHKFTESLLWSDGDFNGDGVVDIPDFNVWNSSKFTLSDGVIVPEPTLPFRVGLLALVGLVIRRLSASQSASICLRRWYPFDTVDHAVSKRCDVRPLGIG